jgi:hypothetical protein
MVMEGALPQLSSGLVLSLLAIQQAKCDGFHYGNPAVGAEFAV